MAKSALGRGFDSLIPTDFAIDSVASPGEQIRQLAVESIVANPEQPRKEFDEKSINELADSIIQHGIIQPLVVTPHKDKYRIVAGERRYRAAQVAGLEKVPAIVRDHEELEELEIALVENVQRVDLSPLEQAVSIVRLRDQFSMSAKEIAQKLGKAETTVSNIVRLLQLPPEAVEAMQKNKITEGHARAILALKPDVEAQNTLLNTIITQKLSVREAEAIVKSSRSVSKTKKVGHSAESKILIESVGASLKGSVNIKPGKSGRGMVTIVYENENGLKTIFDRLK